MIRYRRKSLGMTLDQLAEGSGVSRTMLSEVERSLKNPTVKLAYQIALALGCSLTDLIDERSQKTTVVRSDERRALLDPESGIERYGLSSELARRELEMAWYVIPPGQTTGEMAPNRPGLIEHVTVLRGRLDLRVGGQLYELGPRDTVTYGPQSATEYQNSGDELLEFILLCDSSRAR